MSVINGKACCNCKHCIRVKNPEGCITLHCMVDDGRYIGYLHGLESQERWCRHWARDRISGIDPKSTVAIFVEEYDNDGRRIN